MPVNVVRQSVQCVEVHNAVSVYTRYGTKAVLRWLATCGTSEVVNDHHL